MNWFFWIIFGVVAVSSAAASAQAQTPSPERSFFSRMLHPFSSKKKLAKYQDAHLRGLLVEVQVPTEPIRLSEVRQLRVQAILTNLSDSPISLDFPSSQRIDIQLLNPAGEVLTRWSENRAFAEENGHLTINPREQVVYNETIATRELQPGRVYSVEVVFPRYPELRGRQKFMTAP